MPPQGGLAATGALAPDQSHFVKRGNEECRNYCHPRVGNVVQLVRQLVASQIIIRLRYLPSVLIHSIARGVYKTRSGVVRLDASTAPSAMAKEMKWVMGRRIGPSTSVKKNSATMACQLLVRVVDSEEGP